MLIRSRVTKLSQSYNKNTCLTSVKHSFISSLRLAAVLHTLSQDRDHPDYRVSIYRGLVKCSDMKPKLHDRFKLNVNKIKTLPTFGRFLKHL